MATDTRNIGISLFLSLAIVIGASMSARVYVDRSNTVSASQELAQND